MQQSTPLFHGQTPHDGHIHRASDDYPRRQLTTMQPRPSQCPPSVNNEQTIPPRSSQCPPSVNNKQTIQPRPSQCPPIVNNEQTIQPRPSQCPPSVNNKHTMQPRSSQCPLSVNNEHKQRTHNAATALSMSKYQTIWVTTHAFCVHLTLSCWRLKISCSQQYSCFFELLLRI